MTDTIKQPKHYIANAIEPIDFIIANKLNFCEGNVVKYISRWRMKKRSGRFKKKPNNT